MATVEPSRSRGLIDGTTSTLSCGLHDFHTQDISEWENHIKTEQGHYAVGHNVCFLCGKPYHFTLEDKVPGIIAVKGMATHPECYKQLGGR